jgi:hydroxyacylglutathione hydrolase
MNLKSISNNVKVYGPIKEKDRIPGIDITVDGGDILTFGSFQAKVMDVGGHTRGHIAYHFEDDHCLFCGDALFALGCGRMFEGTPDQFWSSLQALRNLPDETLVYW